MVSPARVGKALTLEEFLRLPGIDERPYREYFDGRIESKMSPQTKHSLITLRLSNHMLHHTEPQRLGLPLPELRCTFAGRSIIPDIAFLLAAHIVIGKDGKVLNPIVRAPDIHIEIVSPDQSVQKCRDKLAFSVSNGCPLGWLIDPERETVHVYRPGRRPRRVPDDGVLDGDPVLPGYRLPVAELFGWMTPWPDWNPAQPSPGSGSPIDGGIGQ
jgi:Uma2 family endonuclease